MISADRRDTPIAEDPERVRTAQRVNGVPEENVDQRDGISAIRAEEVGDLHDRNGDNVVSGPIGYFKVRLTLNPSLRKLVNPVQLREIKVCALSVGSRPCACVQQRLCCRIRCFS